MVIQVKITHFNKPSSEGTMKSWFSSMEIYISFPSSHHQVTLSFVILEPLTMPSCLDSLMDTTSSHSTEADYFLAAVCIFCATVGVAGTFNWF